MVASPRLWGLFPQCLWSDSELDNNIIPRLASKRYWLKVCDQVMDLSTASNSASTMAVAPHTLCWPI